MFASGNPPQPRKWQRPYLFSGFQMVSFNLWTQNVFSSSKQYEKYVISKILPYLGISFSACKWFSETQLFLSGLTNARCRSQTRFLVFTFRSLLFQEPCACFQHRVISSETALKRICYNNKTKQFKVAFSLCIFRQRLHFVWTFKDFSETRIDWYQGRRRQLKSGTAKLCLRTNFRGIRGHAPPDFFSLYRHTRIFTLFRVIVSHIFKETS